MQVDYNENQDSSDNTDGKTASTSTNTRNSKGKRSKKGDNAPRPSSNNGPSESQRSIDSSKTSKEKEYMKLQIWDTAGQEHYRAVTRSYFRNAAGCLLVYDVTRRNTFLHAKDWLEDIKDQAAEGISICLVGNKTDLFSNEDAEDGENEETEDGQNGLEEPNNKGTKGQPVAKFSNSSIDKPQRQVSKQEAQEWADANGILCFVETSAKTGDKVLDAYQYVANDIYQKILQGQCNLADRKSGVKIAGKRKGNYDDMVNLSMEFGKNQNNKANCC